MTKANSPKFKFLAHTADIKFQAFGKTLEETFGNCVLALGKSIYNGKVKNKIKKKIKVSGKDLENLLYEFLEEFLVLFDSEGFLVSKIEKIKVNEKNFEIECEVIGDDSENYEIETHIKSVTYNEMFVKQEKGRTPNKFGSRPSRRSQPNEWIAQVVLDV